MCGGGSLRVPVPSPIFYLPIPMPMHHSTQPNVTLYLVRHGENRANLTKEFSHRVVDYPLTEKGVLQARQTAEYLQAHPIDAVYSSPLRRARQTADIIGAALNLPVIEEESFREINVGALELEPPTPANWQLHNGILGAWLRGDGAQRFPEGEDYHTLLARMQQGLAAVTVEPARRNVVIVGHGGIFTLTIRDICANVDLETLLATENHNCSVSTLELPVGQLGGGRLIEWARSTHLSGEAAQLISATPDREHWSRHAADEDS